MLGLMSASKLLKERSAERPAMQSNDLSTVLSQTHRGRDLAIGGSVVSAALIAGVLVCLADPNARKRERPIDHVGYCGRRNSQQCRAEGRSVVEFALEG
jgi:hypothetical protein